MERVFRVPFIEAYGMTEAAPQIASNRLARSKRKPGSVGLAAGPDVAIMDDEGNPTPPGEDGEVVVRGPNVMLAYENNPDANGSAFVRGWLRTGDRGHLDSEGYLFITGRLKEIINRGGEKISPREVDEIMMEHPAVHQCVTFGMPHAMLGEEVAAAIVLKHGAQASDAELREFARVRLADFKVPRKILILTEIPVGATGKLQRIGLAQKLGLG
jgi:acyl-CoA synthetase (AMP-forming)/AMP-acid ligase II